MSYLAREDRRSAVLDATIGLFEREGFAAVTTRSVAAESRVSPGLIHHLFGSTAELTATAWSTYLERGQAAFRSVAEAQADDALELFFDNFLDADRSSALRVWADAWQFAQRNRDFTPAFTEGLHALVDTLAGVLGSLVDRPEAAATRLLLLAFGLAGAAAIDPDRLGRSTAVIMREALERELSDRTEAAPRRES